MQEPKATTRAEPPAPDRYSTFLSLSGDGIARFELDRPLRVDAAEDEQVRHILEHSRVAECNELFAGFYGRGRAEMVGLAMGEFVPAQDPSRLQGIRQFIRSGYRMVYVEEEHPAGPGSSRWLGSSALGAAQDGLLHDFWLCLRDVTDRKRAEADRERRGRILEAVAFCAARLLQPGSWRMQADDVVARLGYAAETARAWIAEIEEPPGSATRMVFRSAWQAAGVESGSYVLPLQGGLSLADVGVPQLEAELRAGRPVVTLVSSLAEHEHSVPHRVGSKSFAVVPILCQGRLWGALGFGETRYEREWSPLEVEALKAAAAVIGNAVEREAADESLRESEERFETLSAAAFEAIAITENGAFVDGNEQLAGMLGCELSELVGRPVQGFIAPEDRERVRAYIASGIEGPYEHVALRLDGTSFPVEVRARSLSYGGRTLRVTAVRDVSARVQAEDRQRLLEADLRQAAEQWRQTFDALDLGIVLADAEGHIVRLNRAALDEVGGPGFADAVGRTLGELPDGEPWHNVREIHREVGEKRATVTAEAREASTGRSFYFLGSPWFRGVGEPPWRVVTFRDVTDYTNMQEQLRRARVMEAMGSLVAGVAHEVRNPLFSMSATVDALEAEIGQRPEFSDYAALLRTQVGRLSQLMRDLLDYGKPSLLRRSPTQLQDVLRRAGRACATLAREREVAIVEELAGDLPVLEIDPARTEQVFENLLANAIQHAPAGSTVRIVAGLDKAGPEPRVHCRVEDDGPGLDPESLPQVFEPFFSRRKGGTGLGLSIVRRVVEAHGGTVTAGNREAGGACFTVLLPALRAEGGEGP
jgi:PAS domain S-box-containing protein